MALCDQLEAEQKERELHRDALRSVSLHRLTATPAEGDTTRNVNFFLKRSERLITRPEHVTALLHCVLALAVRGQLLPQDTNDESARGLLRRISSERHEMLAQGFPNRAEANNQQKKQREQRVPTRLPALPDGWEWATLMQCSALVVDCRNKTVPYTSPGVTLLRTTNVRNGRIVLEDHRFVSEETYLRWSSRYQPQPGDIVITREAPMGEVAPIPTGLRVCLGQRLMLVRLVRETVDGAFLVYSLRDSELLQRVQDKPIGALVQHLRVGGIESLLVPLPPLAEQRRIVAKVDKLMALCDELEAALASAWLEQGRLLQALISETLKQNC
ncbi:MAG: restriction endonuclease subunit S [Candidatus Dormibacteria bacterium]